MGDAFLTRRGVKSQKITFNNTPMVLTKTLSNALSVGRYNMAVASDEEYIAFVGGLNSSGSAVNNIDFFDRGGKHWIANWPIALSEMAAVITNHRLICFGGRKSDGSLINSVKSWFLSDALLNSGSQTVLPNLSRATYGIAAIPFEDMVLIAGGGFNYDATGDNGSTSDLACYSLMNSTLKTVASLGRGRRYTGILRRTYKAVMTAGGLRVAPDSIAAIDDVTYVRRNSDGTFESVDMAALAAAQWRTTQASIYDQGVRYNLFGLGVTAPTTQGNIVQPSLVVPNIDVYAVATSGSVSTEKFTTFTLPLDSNPISSVALGFGDCVLYVVGYMNALTKGYLVQLNPLRITTMEFNFRSSEFTAGVIGNDVGFIAGGTKNGQFSRDVEMIQLLRNVPIYPGMKYKVGSMTSEETSNILTLHPLNDEIKLSGYMKL